MRWPLLRSTGPPRAAAAPVTAGAATVLRDLVDATEEGLRAPGSDELVEAIIARQLRDSADLAQTTHRVEALLRALDLSFGAVALTEQPLAVPSDDLRRWGPLLRTLQDKLLAAGMPQRASEPALPRDAPVEASAAAAPSDVTRKDTLIALRMPEKPVAPLRRAPTLIPERRRPRRPSPAATVAAPLTTLEEFSSPPPSPPSPSLPDYLMADSVAELEVGLAANELVPSFRDCHRAPRLIATYLPQPQRALGWLADQVRRGEPGGVLEAEAFAYIYNLPAQLWRLVDPHDGTCRRHKLLRRGDDSENYLSLPIRLVSCGDAWSLCDRNGVCSGELFVGNDGLYRALITAAHRSCRSGLVCGVPDDVQQVRGDVAGRFEGLGARPILHVAEAEVATSWLRQAGLPHLVVTTRYDRRADREYLFPDPKGQPLPQLGLAHSARRGWRVFLAVRAEQLTAEGMATSAVMNLGAADTGRLEVALAQLLSMVTAEPHGEDSRTAWRRAVDESFDAPARRPAYSAHYAEQVMETLQGEHAVFLAAAAQGAAWARNQQGRVEAMSVAYARKVTYCPYRDAAQEQTIKKFLAYMGQPHVYGSEISAAGLAEVVGRRVRVWTLHDDDQCIALKSSRVYGRADKPVDILRVGPHYLVLYSHRLQDLGTTLAADHGTVQRSQLSGPSNLSLRRALLAQQIARDVGGGGNCQYLAIAYSCNWGDFATSHRGLRDGWDAAACAKFCEGLRPDATFAEITRRLCRAAAEGVAGGPVKQALRDEALRLFGEQTAGRLRQALVTHWSNRLQAADYAQARQVQRLVKDLEFAAHSEVGEVLRLVAAEEAREKQAGGLWRESTEALKGRCAVIARVLGFCPESDERLRAQGTQALKKFEHEIERRDMLKALGG